MQNIEKSIYSLDGIKRHLLPLWWAVILTAVGGIALIFFVKFPNITPALNALLLGVIAMGVFGLFTLLCFYTFGDRYRPLHKPSRQLLEVVHTYYPAAAKNDIMAALQSHDIVSLQSVKKSTAPQLVLVEYSNDSETIRYVQLQEYRNECYTPLSDIFNLSQQQ